MPKRSMKHQTKSLINKKKAWTNAAGKLVGATKQGGKFKPKNGYFLSVKMEADNMRESKNQDQKVRGR